MQGGPGKISISPLRPPCTPRNPIETIAPRRVPPPTPSLHHAFRWPVERSETEGLTKKQTKRDAFASPTIVLYSFLIAAKGESFMARMAGYRPDMSATTTENANAPTAR